MFNNEKNEITLIFNGEELDDSQAISYLKSLNRYTLKTIDVSKESLTSSQIAQIAKKMGVNIKALIDQKNVALKKEIEQKDMAEENILKILTNNPKYLRTPITTWNGNTEYWDTAYDMIKLEMKFKK